MSIPSKLLARAVRLLAQRDHTEYELRSKLSTQSPSQYSTTDSQYPSTDIDAVIRHCYQHNWLNDEQFVYKYLLYRSKKGYGPTRIRTELMQKGIDSSILQEVLSVSDIHWISSAKKIVAKRFGSHLPTQWNEKAKIQRFLFQRGFTLDDIQSVIRDLIER